MTPTLSPQQREAANCALIGKLPEPVIAAIHAAGMSTADVADMCLDAALPAIIGAVLERAAQCAEQHTFRAEYTPNAIAADIRALAEEAR